MRNLKKTPKARRPSLNSSATSRGRRHVVIPDTQVKPGVNTDHLEAAGKYIASLTPDVLVHIGDHYDLPSLSSYDKGKKSHEGRRYLADIKAGNEAMDRFMAPIHKEIARRKKNKKRQWNPELHFCLGNHENRITRACEDSAELDGVMSFDDFNLVEHGFTVHDFLKPLVIDGICYAHYHTSGIMGRPVSSAQTMLNKKHMSTVMGHVQDRQIAYAKRADGTRITGIFAGIFYTHSEGGYLTPQTDTATTWSGIWVFNECKDGAFDEMPVSTGFIMEKFGVSRRKRR
jgi:hypothetical protein